MNFTASFLALLAAAQSIAAFPFGGSHSDDLVAPVPVTQLVCDGDTYKCTASLDFGDGRWVADWNTAVFHTGLFGGIDHKETIARMAMAPVPVTALNCDGDTYKCTANLKFGDGRWVAQWSANVFHTFAPSVEEPNFAPVPVTKLTCDGDTYKCTANLQFGDNRWVAQWGSNVYHRGFTATSEKPSFLQQ
ncbi:Alpha-(1-6)-linked fucose-specific lectin [Psilocybe cubensis]|uniref:Uncharacterized protein n=3 Tax=Psilocybe cubensis TaxID=181762 RepID=A0A8H7Y4G8_PSICU|nr:Alpha-(1-6)-linked fucose-specific lectin [Psilocybe cubensis]XP_047751227.1 Alpha-(1-6)-linked fucose-specific lectin [Psilocybe cubensis]KAH9483586.1 Alpha-(1-6)-linked fucose-specific lectin [Psilocybe cubensis]KAH9483602.1 Alpha-(1-6)-linked fucose-specific lectin [Psilocybe cubensis]